MSKQPKLDQFYTKPSIVEKVLSMIDCSRYELVLEPSAGAGDFLERLPKATRVGVDLEPAHPEVTQQDFFDYVPHLDTTSILTIGNPPFGKNSSLAVRFFNHAASFSDCIAFIVPRTFRKPSLINRLDDNFHIVSQEILPLDAFYLPSGESYKVPTVFQVWGKKDYKREKIKTETEHKDFEFMKLSHGGLHPTKSYFEQCQAADFCVQRVGVNAGEVYNNTDKTRYGKYRDWKSHYFIKENTANVRSNMESIDWNYNESPKFDNAGNPSISKHELIKAYIKAKENNG